MKVKIPIQSESALQSSIVLYMRNELKVQRGLFFSIPNDGAFTNRFLSTGMVSGMPDLCFLVRGTIVFFELKTLTGRLSQKQDLVHKNLREAGYEVHVVRNFEDFKTIVSKYIP